MNMNYVDNLMFQKKNFPEVYKSYLSPESKDAPEYKKCIISGRETNYFYLFVDETVNILSFIEEHFNSCINFDKPVPACEIIFGYEDKAVGFENGILKIEVNHPYLDRNKPIIISRSIIIEFLEKSAAFYTYKAKPKPLDEIIIKKYYRPYNYKTHNLPSRKELLDCIRDSQPVYSFSIRNTEIANRRVNLQDSIPAAGVSLEVIGLVNGALKGNLQENEILQKCVDCVMGFFSNTALELLKRHLQNEEFSFNYILVEKYLMYEHSCGQELEKHLKNGLILSVRELKKIQNDHARQYNEISNDKNILELDDFVKIQLEKLNSLLEEI